MLSSIYTHTHTYINTYLKHTYNIHTPMYTYAYTYIYYVCIYIYTLCTIDISTTYMCYVRVHALMNTYGHAHTAYTYTQYAHIYT